MLQPTGVLYCNSELTEPWGIRVPSLPGVMNVEVVTGGSCWLQLEDRAPELLPEGSLALIPRGNTHTLRGNPGDRVTPLEEIPVERIGERFEYMRFGGGGRETRITYYGIRFDPYLAKRLLSLLPEVLHLRTQSDEDGWLASTVRFIATEARDQLPGTETVISRLADVLVIQAIRTWLESQRDSGHGWVAALYDRQVGAAMSLMHRHPERDWQVESLARAVGMSRAGFSARFTALVGESAMRYLTNLRMQLAHRELRETRDTLASIAERVGYSSEPAFHRAYKRVMGTAPGEVRKRGLDVAAR